MSIPEYPVTATATLRHERAGRYAKQLISHWKAYSEPFLVEGETSTLVFPTVELGQCLVAITVTDDEVGFAAAAINETQLDYITGEVTSHIFGWAKDRDTLEIVWSR